MNMTFGCFAHRRPFAGSVSIRSMAAQQFRRTRLGPASLQSALRNHAWTCWNPGNALPLQTEVFEAWPRREQLHQFVCNQSTLPAQHKRRVFITFRGEEGQSHISCWARSCNPCFVPNVRRQESWGSGATLDLRFGSNLSWSRVNFPPQVLQPHCTCGIDTELEERCGCQVLDISPWHMGQFIGRHFLLRFVESNNSRQSTRFPSVNSLLVQFGVDQQGICLLLTGTMVALDASPSSSLTPSTFRACCFAFSSVRNLLGWWGGLTPVRNSTR